MAPASPETRARPRPGQRPKPRRRTRDAGTEGLPGYSEQTCKVSLGARAQGVVGGQSGRKTVLGQRTNFGEAGRDTPVRPQGTPGQSPHSRDWVLRVGHSTQHLRTSPPVGATSAPESQAPRARGGFPIPCAPGRAARGGAARRRDLPTQPGCAGSSRLCSARRGRLGARGAAARPPAPSPRSRRRRPATHPARTSRTARATGSCPARPPPAPWPARQYPDPPPRPALASRLRALPGSAGEGQREGSAGSARDRWRPAGPGGGGCRRPHPARQPQHPGKGVWARRSRVPPLDALLPTPHPPPFPLFLLLHLFPKKTSSPLKQSA